jgi:exosome complex exonuclease DIS3/RRP44
MSVNTRSKPDLSGPIKEALRDVLSEGDTVKKLSAKILDEIESRLTSLVDAAVEVKCARIEGHIAALEQRIVDLERENGLVNKLVVHRTDELEQYQRRTSLRIFGLPETKGEQTDDIVSGFLKSKLGVDVEPYDLCRTHRVGPPPRRPKQTSPGQSPPPPRHRAILVKFATYNVRRQVFSAKSKLKGTGYVICEDLTSIRRQVFLDAVAMHGKGNVWSIDGVIKWKGADGSIHRATSKSDLQ